MHLTRFVRLTPSERRLVLEALALVLATWVRLRLRRGRALCSLQAATRAIPFAPSSPETEARVRWAISAVARRIPLARNCLVQAMVAQELLRGRGCSSRIVVGVARADDGRLRAHAWVESAASHLVVGRNEAGAFTPLAGGHAESS